MWSQIHDPESYYGTGLSESGNLLEGVVALKNKKIGQEESKSKIAILDSECQDIDISQARYPELEPRALQDVLQLVIQEAMQEDPQGLQEGDGEENAQPFGLQKPSVRAWRQHIRGRIVPPCAQYAKMRSQAQQELNFLPLTPTTQMHSQQQIQLQQPLKIQQEPYRYVPAYVDLAGFLFPDLFWSLIDYFVDQQLWLPFEQLNPFFKVICRQFRVDADTLIDAPGFAPLWVSVLRDTDEAAFRTVVQHFFSAFRLPPWRSLPDYVLAAFADAGVAEFQYALPFDPFAHLRREDEELTTAVTADVPQRPA